MDKTALAEHLQSGRQAGAALDVFAEEPEQRSATFSSSLQGLPNVILTPHVAGSTEEAQQDIGSFVASKLVNYADRGETTLCANLPELAAPQPPPAVRLAHLHHNVPGVLAAADRVFAESGVNIDQQSLATNGDMGYLLSDVDSLPTQAKHALTTLPETVAVRELSR